MQRQFGIGVGALGILVVVLIGSTGGVAATDSCTELSGPVVIDQPGCYELNESVADSSADVYVEIRSSDVVLEGTGHTVDGDGSSDTIGIEINGSAAAPLSNVTVRNVTVDDWGTAIYFRDVTGGTARNVTARSNYHQGIQIRNSANVLLEDVVTADNPGSYEGVLVVDSADVTIENLTSMREGRGIDLWDVNGATIRNSTFTEGSNGIDIDDSGGVVIRDNAFENGGAVSSSGTGLEPNVIANNTVTGDRWNGYCGGFSFRSAADDVVSNNTLEGCHRGMYVRESFRLTIENNFIDNGPTYGNSNNYGIELSAGAGHALVNNTVTNSGTPGWDEPGITLGSTERAYLSGNTLVDNPVNLRVRGYDWSEVNHVIDSTNTVEGRPVYYYVNGSAGSVTVPADAGWVGLVGTTGATVADVTFPANNQENVYAWGTDDTVIRNVTATGSRHAVWADYHNDGLVVENSTFDDAGAIYLHRSTDSLVVDTAVMNSGGNGADLYLATGTIFENVTFRNSDAHGVQIKADSDFVTITNSTIHSSDRSAVYTAHNTNLSVTNSVLTDNSGGVIASVYGMANATIAGNVIASNDGDGVRFYRYPEHITIVDNEIVGNGDDGVVIGSDSRNIYVADNNVSDNGGYGVDLGGNGHDDTVAGNVIAGNTLGLDLSSSYVDLAVSDNEFINAQNVNIPSGVTNVTWNATITSGRNVVGGPSVGGNYWATPNGTGYSETCVDADDDGFCDAPYALDANNTDYLPLVAPTGVPAAEFEYDTLEISPRTVAVNETVTVTATVANAGDADGTYAAELFVNGTLEETATGSLSAGETETVTFTVSFDRSGTYAVAVDALPAVTVVAEASDETDGADGSDKPAISVAPQSIDFGARTVGDSERRTVTIENGGNATLSVTDVVVVGDAGHFGVDATAFDIAPGETETVTVAFEPTAAGSVTGTLRIHSDDATTSRVDVSLVGTGTAGSDDGPSDHDGTDDPDDDDGSSGGAVDDDRTGSDGDADSDGTDGDGTDTESDDDSGTDTDDSSDTEDDGDTGTGAGDDNETDTDGASGTDDDTDGAGDAESDGDSGTDGPDDESDSVPGFGITVTIGALLTAGVLGRVRRVGESDD